jgi:hypothetical protein
MLYAAIHISLNLNNKTILFNFTYNGEDPDLIVTGSVWIILEAKLITHSFLIKHV